MGGGELPGVESKQGEGVRKLPGLFDYGLRDPEPAAGPASRGRVPAPFIGGMIAPCLWLPANWGSNIESLRRMRWHGHAPYARLDDTRGPCTYAITRTPSRRRGKFESRVLGDYRYSLFL